MLTTLVVLGALVVLIGAFPIMTNNRCKNYIIEHKEDITMDKLGSYRLQTPDLNYYEEVTISANDTTGYYIIFWADRGSWKWYIKSDKLIDANISYKEYKGKNTELDKKLLDSILN